ncbi:SulP family inorganic anion transporter [Verminephrobacter aporrectodeae]|uniref:SulP family inorganic anion transporter n=1 Tax=Verminephrobacter aporrectodeae TaxID=1110389 RepID=UPI0022379383|nr:SulP family inorganic anion transporter [Verminephrobacter aporrectodeae]MCW5255110.1 STAS domain-containing protein [Verminephrobacter aporrectodeae subsp. tuberculatae]MCW8177287.1 STAS domain-containing protein [Verminephrobacter aporrectodeae subsp. tuberculatae]MCW8204713.1 STAS domain-containing protein [Verminephrobacter aporrectodeae subsp. tuberculatae]
MSFSLAFRPRVIDALRGYNRGRWLADVGAGVTVGIVALPLAMAFAIASGLKPEAGLWTAIIAGFLISALGGTNAQIGGPAGAFIVIIYDIVNRYGVANLLIATACAGVLLLLLGLFRLGTVVRFVPVGVVIGFTNGIAVLIALSQAKDWLGLSIEHMPGDFFSQMRALVRHMDSFNPYAFGLGTACVVGLFVWPRLTMKGSPVMQVLERHTVHGFAHLPAPVVALVTLSLLAWALGFPVETIGSRFGGIPRTLPGFALPDFSWETVRLLVTPTVTIALLGAVESLLCARVADQLTSDPQHKKHDPNQELMAQGLANLVVPFFGGMPATGTIARTVTNIRAGATSPVAGMVHALTLALIVLLAAPLALHIPLAVLAGILLYVAWNMGEWHEFVRLRHFSNHYRLLMLGTFFLTVVFNLIVAMEVGLFLACALFVRRMSALFRVERQPESGSEAGAAPHPGATWRLHGALFFGAAAKIDPIVQAVEAGPPGMELVLDASELVALDTTGLDALVQILRAVNARGGRLCVIHLHEQPRSLIERSGFGLQLAAQAAPCTRDENAAQ